MTKQESQGVLLVNLGSPDSTKVKDVRKYLREFLMDKRVIDLPFLARFFLVNCIIAPFRAKKSAAAYQKIWWKEGSPLKVISERLSEKVQRKSAIPVRLAMRYAEPSIEERMGEMYAEGIRQLHVIPLYPQYAMSTTETVVEKCKECLPKFPGMVLSFEAPFYNDPLYISCLANSIEKQIEPAEVDVLLFSYHGIPERHIYKTDTTDTCKIGSCCFQEENPSHSTCYRHQCYTTTELTRQALNVSKHKVYQSFQSRLGKDPWLRPYTDETLEKFPTKGKKKIAVVAPAFVSDCLETLEEIAIEGKQEFIENGGNSFTYVPCLNDEDQWVDYLVGRINIWISEKVVHLQR